MKVAVTGATGFVGGHLTRRLLRREDAVTCLVRNPGARAHWERLGCRVILGSLEDPAALARLVEDTEVVYHVAGLVAAHSAREFERVNCEGTRCLARNAAQARVRRFLYVSSLAATGPNPPDEPSRDATPARPVSHYGRSKLRGEAAVRTSGVAFAVVRPSVVYGPGDRQLLKVVQLASRGWGLLLGSGCQQLSLIHVSDLAEALIAAATQPVSDGRIYHAAHAEIVTQRELVEEIARALGRQTRMLRVSEPLVRGVLRITGSAARLARRRTLLTADKAHELLAEAWTCSSDALTRDTGWHASMPLAEGIAHTLEWYRARGWI